MPYINNLGLQQVIFIMRTKYMLFSFFFFLEFKKWRVNLNLYVSNWWFNILSYLEIIQMFHVYPLTQL
jgi:hypothetical protein